MLNHAMQNAGEHVSKIEWMRCVLPRICWRLSPLFFCHVLKNCMLPIITLLGMSFGTLLGAEGKIVSGEIKLKEQNLAHLSEKECGTRKQFL